MDNFDIKPINEKRERMGYKPLQRPDMHHIETDEPKECPSVWGYCLFGLFCGIVLAHVAPGAIDAVVSPAVIQH